MKSQFRFLLTLLSFSTLFFANFCYAQRPTIVLDTSVFDTDFQDIDLTYFDGWLFKAGHDPGWATIQIDTIGWEKMSPYEISTELADANGKLEGWFRLIFKLDHSFEDVQLGLSATRFAATDVYIDGVYIASFGDTGFNGDPYAEYTAKNEVPIPLKLAPNIDHVMAFHIVDYRSPIKPSRFKTQDNGLGEFGALLKLTNAKTHSRSVDFTAEIKEYFTFLSSVCGVLSVLFWLLYSQNRNEGNMFFIALASTLFSTAAYLVKVYEDSCISHLVLVSYQYGWNFCLGVSVAANLIILANIFGRRINSAIIGYCIFCSFSMIVDFHLSNGRFLPVLYGINVSVYIYLIVTSWRSLKGPQLYVVVGIVTSFFAALVYGYNAARYNTSVYPYSYLYMTLTFLSFPFSLMVYVATRFREILYNVRSNAEAVVKITEEKREILSQQNALLEQKVTERTRELEASQSQLIQSEKMASLGELTAGIAHEIQNPLNFVNNFSDINNELLLELVDEIGKGNVDDATSIARDILSNEKKINHHGKRAEDIVKGMLQHSRGTSITKEPTDINALADEFLRLAYHGFRAKNKLFNAAIQSDFDSTLEKINVIPQDIGRLLLNLMNNAFYAVNERMRKMQASGRTDYEPTVAVTTRKIIGTSGTSPGVEIKVIDNGDGIPKKVLDKIFQPFFTTKPTGQGTGLGLSLSYDIVKAHGGTVNVETMSEEAASKPTALPGESLTRVGTTFTILLPEA